MAEERSFFQHRFQLALIELGLQHGGFHDSSYLTVLHRAITSIDGDADAQRFFLDFVQYLREYDLEGLTAEEYAARDVRSCLGNGFRRDVVEMWERVMGPALAEGAEGAALAEVERILGGGA